MVPRFQGERCSPSVFVCSSLMSCAPQGTIERAEKDGYKVSGIIEQIDENTVEITELPIRTWTQSYKELLEGWVVGTEKAPALIKVGMANMICGQFGLTLVSRAHTGLQRVPHGHDRSLSHHVVGRWQDRRQTRGT